LKELEGWYAYEFDKSKVTQGTILLTSAITGLTDKYYLVLNPECDLLYEKSDYINLVGQGDLKSALRDILSDFTTSLDSDHWAGLKTLSNNLLKNIIRKLKDQINGRHAPRWFFVPSDYQEGGLPLMVFDLQQIYTVEVEEKTFSQLLAGRKAVLCSPFKEALVTRLYSYLTRVGTDDAHKEDLCIAIIAAGGLKAPEETETVGTAPTSKE